MKLKGKILYISVIVLFFAIFLFSLLLGGKESVPAVAVSDGFSLSFSTGNIRRFKSDDFLLNCDIKGSAILKITSLPSGSLSFKNEPITEGQSVALSEISSLTYLSNEEERDFFTAEVGNLTLTVNMCPCEIGNTAPSGENITLNTAQNITIRDSLPVFDREGDEVYIRVTDSPEKGLLSFDGISYTYTPYHAEKGNDEFKFIATDVFGNYSTEYTAKISIETAPTDNYYTDTATSSGAYAAVKLSEAGIFSGEKVGSMRLFNPSKQVEMGEFLMLTNEVADVLAPPAVCFDTGLSSNEDTIDYLRPYIKTALESGIIEDYSPNMALTKEAAYHYAAKMLNLPESESTSVIFPNLSQISPEYIPAYVRLYNAGYITFKDIENPKSAFTRNDLARLLYAIMQKNK